MEKKQKNAAAAGIPGGQRRDIMGKEIIRNRDFTNEELLSRKDEISLLMLINKIQEE